MINEPQNRHGTFGNAFDRIPDLPFEARRKVNRDLPVITHWKESTKLIEINDILHRWRFNLPPEGTMQVFTSTDATPTVLGGGMFQTAGTTAITDFDDGVIGDVLYIHAKSSITITHGAPILLNGDANYVMVSGDTLVLAMFDDQVWTEVARGGQAGSSTIRRYYVIEVFSPTVDLTTGDGKKYIHIPSDLDTLNLVEVHAEVITAGTTGTTDIQIRNVTDSVDMLSTKLTIDTTPETGSDTAATPAVIDTTKDDVATNDLIAIDVDAVHTTTPKGLIVTLGFE